MRVAIKDLKVGSKFSMNEGGKVLVVVAADAELIVAKGGEAGLKRLPAQDRAVWLIDAPKAAPAPKAAAPAPKAVKKDEPKAVKKYAPKAEVAVEAKIEAPEAE
jgi:hypothetical protein